MKCLFKGRTSVPAAADQSSVAFSINGKPYSVQADGVSPDSRLLDYIRDEALLKGTKWTCREGGCGACVVAVRTKDPKSGEEVVRAVNSCLAPVLSCQGWDISTVEDLGNKKEGYHPISKRLASFGGSQCGFCSGGMVMNMYSLVNSKPQVTSEDIEDNFDGQICRCTGYRPILDAFKSFTVDADPELTKRCADIEDACNGCPSKSGANQNAGCCKSSGCCSRPCGAFAENKGFDFHLASGEQWVRATDLKTVFETLKTFAKNGVKYRIVAGNTGTGVFKEDGPYAGYLEVNGVAELTTQVVNKSEAVLGAANTLTRTIEFLQDLSKKEGFEYAAQMSKHIKRVANTPVRNCGTVAGNLMMKHAHNDFPSDIFLLLESVGAKLSIASSQTEISSYSPTDFLGVDMKGKVIVSISLPIRQGGYVFRSFKITKRYSNAHAYVNGGLLFKVDATKNFKVLEKPTICFGGISKSFVHASKTEAFLTGAELGDVTLSLIHI